MTESARRDRPRPPRVPRALLALLPRDHREHVLGDLAEGWEARAAGGTSSPTAAIWFWKTLAVSLVASALTRARYRLRDGRSGSDRPRRRALVVGFGHDLRCAVRSLVRHPGLAVGAIVTLALGIGANTVMFSMDLGMSRVVQRFDAPDQLVCLWGVERDRERAPVSAREFEEWRARADTLDDVGVYRPVTRYVSGDGEPQRVRAVLSSANLLPMLGFDAAVGRLHGRDDEVAGSPPVAVITHRLWQDRYAGDVEALGRTIRLNDVAFTIVGVLPAQVDVEQLWRDAAVFLPLALGPGDAGGEERVYRALARLADGATLDGARAQLAAIGAGLDESRAGTDDELRATVEPFREVFYSPEDRLAVGSLVAAAFAVLLIACVNLANVLLAKGSARQGDVAVRLALGASRGRVVRHLLTESLLLALLGGAFGLVLGEWGLSLVLASFPVMPFLPEEVGLDGVVAIHALAVALIAALVFGLAPALLATRTSLADRMKAGGSHGARAGRSRFRHAILVGQLALTVPLVVACVIGFRQVQVLSQLDFGFQADDLLLAQIDLPEYRFADEGSRAEFVSGAVEAVRGVPGIAAAAAGMNVPIGAGQSGVWGPLVVEGREAEEGGSRGPRGYEVVTPGYFETLGVPLRQGRLMTWSDGPGDPVVAVVNETLARRYWPDQDPIGRRLVPDVEAGGWNTRDVPVEITVVGVIANFGATFYGDPPNPSVYLSHRQVPVATMKLVARTDVDPVSVAPALREAVSRVDAAVPVSQIQAGDDLVDVWLQESRTVAAILGVLGVLALGMAAIGLYGMVAYSVAQRTFELGLRMVLGADGGTIRRTAMRSYVALAASGLGIGLFISAVGAFLVRSQLVMLRIPYASTVGGLVALLTGVVLLASYLPARRATSIEPVQALRSE